MCTANCKSYDLGDCFLYLSDSVIQTVNAALLDKSYSGDVCCPPSILTIKSTV